MPVVAIISGLLAGQQHVPGMMIIIVPLRPILASRRVGARIEQARAIVVVLSHQMNAAAGLGGGSAGFPAPLRGGRPPPPPRHGVDPPSTPFRRTGIRATPQPH